MTAKQVGWLPDIHFSVASALLRELGERLVGRPSVALAELIKNSYDADATAVDVHLKSDSIVVADNGHGMTKREFEDFWMRIGSQHKRELAHSRLLRRQLTGSKGVGRLAVQFLGHEVIVITKSEGGEALYAQVNWDEAASRDELTEAVAHVRWADGTDLWFPQGSGTGTYIEVRHLEQEWDEEEVKRTARQIWMLQPPSAVDREKMQFAVTFRSDKPGLEENFGKQMSAILDIWHARISGKLFRQDSETGQKIAINRVMVSFKNGETHKEDFVVDGPLVETLEYDIRVYDLVGRQRFNISVELAREYLDDFGNVSVYDGNFRLPYYGRNTDWLDIEKDHAHRLSKSKLLPMRLQVTEGLNNLPTMTRVLGSVRVDTSGEERSARVDLTDSTRHRREFLQISVTRDRLLDNRAHDQLREMVRIAIDYYAVLQTRRKIRTKAAAQPSLPLTKKIETVEKVLEQHRESLPRPVYEQLHAEISESVRSAETERRESQGYMGLLGALATAGMTMTAYQHEIGRRLTTIEEALNDLEAVDRSTDDLHANAIATIRTAISEIRANRAMFSYFLDQEAREQEVRYPASSVVKDVFSRIERLLRGTKLDAKQIPEDLRLPEARYMEWVAIFQNVIINAANAMLDAKEKLVLAHVEISGNERTLRIEDTGAGVDLRKAERLFQPFERRMAISSQRRALGLGGSGLGLTIVRMIADRIGCQVKFLPPAEGFATCFAVRWREG